MGARSFWRRVLLFVSVRVKWIRNYGVGKLNDNQKIAGWCCGMALRRCSSLTCYINLRTQIVGDRFDWLRAVRLHEA